MTTGRINQVSILKTSALPQNRSSQRLDGYWFGAKCSAAPPARETRHSLCLVRVSQAVSAMPPFLSGTWQHHCSRRGIRKARQRHIPGGYALAITPKAIVFGLAISQLPTDHSFSSSSTELLASAACHRFLSRNRWLLSVALPFAFRRVRIVDAN